MEYRALLMEYRALLIEDRAPRNGILEYWARLIRYRALYRALLMALWMKHEAPLMDDGTFLMECWAPLMECRALIMKYRAFSTEH
jgi:hypothetical protein